MRAAVYSRISRDVADEGKGVQRQREDCEALCEKRGYTVVAVYEDNDISAAGQVKKQRPSYDAMLDAARANQIDVIVAYSNSRLTRRPRELEDLIDLHSAHGTLINTVVSGDDDLSIADGRLMARLKANIDAAEAERTGERLVRQKAQRAAEGKPQGGRYRVYGYTRSFEVITDEAAIVLEAFERKAKGESATAIAKDLNDRGVVNAQGNKWTQANLGKMLSKPGYAGLRSHNGKVIGPTNYPAIISQALYEAVTALPSTSKGVNTRQHLLSGILVCSSCLITMNGKKTNAGTAKEKATYVCPPSHDGCGRSIKMSWVDERIVWEMHRKIQDSGTPEVAIATISHDDEIAELNSAIEELEAAYLAKALSLTDMLRLKKEQEKKRDALVKESAQSVVTSLGVLQPFEDFEDANLSQKRLYLTQHIANVVVSEPKNSSGKNVRDDSRLEVHFTDGTVKRLANEKSVIVDRFGND